MGFELTEKRRANISKILVNLGTAVFATVAIRNLIPGTIFNTRDFAIWAAASAICFVIAIIAEK